MDWLKEKRIDLGYTHDDVAKKCNISRSYYTHIENGTKTPTVSVAKNIGKILGVNWTNFFVDECSLKEHKAVN